MKIKTKFKSDDSDQERWGSSRVRSTEDAPDHNSDYSDSDKQQRQRQLSDIEAGQCTQRMRERSFRDSCGSGEGGGLSGSRQSSKRGLVSRQSEKGRDRDRESESDEPTPTAGSSEAAETSTTTRGALTSSGFTTRRSTAEAQCVGGNASRSSKKLLSIRSADSAGSAGTAGSVPVEMDLRWVSELASR